MKSPVPDSLKADLPPTTWGKSLTATPVAMTVIIDSRDVDVNGYS